MYCNFIDKLGYVLVSYPVYIKIIRTYIHVHEIRKKYVGEPWLRNGQVSYK